MRVILLGLVAICLPAAELDDNTVSVTAYQTAISSFSTASISVTITAPVATGLDEILGIVGEAGITAGEFASAYGWYRVSQPTMTDWSFTHVVGFETLKGTLAALARIQTRLQKANAGPSLQFEVYSSGTNPADSCSYPSLLSDARRQAESLASAVGRRAGSIVTLSDGSSVDPRSGQAFPGAILRAVGFGVTPVYVCSLTAQFKLTL